MKLTPTKLSPIPAAIRATLSPKVRADVPATYEVAHAPGLVRVEASRRVGVISPEQAADLAADLVNAARAAAFGG